MLSCERAAMLGIKINLQYSSLIWQCKPSRDNNNRGEETEDLLVFRESRLDIFLMINVFFVWCKKSLANLDKYDSEKGVCVCVQVSDLQYLKPDMLSEDTPIYLSLFFLAFFLSSLNLSSSWTNSISSFTFWRTLTPWSLPFSSETKHVHPSLINI